MVNNSDNMEIIDSHCHLDFKEFEPDLASILKRAREAGVSRMLSISTSLTRISKVIEIADRFDEVYCSVGVHPQEIENERLQKVGQLLKFTSHPKVIGIGESGLDYHYDNISLSKEQKQNFAIHIEASRISQLPLIIHSRDADNDMAEFLEKEYRKGEFTFVLHCFTGGQNLADRALKLGGYISFSGIITFKNADVLRSIAKNIPTDRLLVETDAPYLAPVPFRGKRNEPAYVTHTHAELAKIKGISYYELSHITNENFYRLFSKMPRVDVTIG